MLVEDNDSFAKKSDDKQVRKMKRINQNERTIFMRNSFNNNDDENKELLKGKGFIYIGFFILLVIITIIIIIGFLSLLYLSFQNS